jgi:hypothetical protein
MFLFYYGHSSFKYFLISGRKLYAIKQRNPGLKGAPDGKQKKIQTTKTVCLLRNSLYGLDTTWRPWTRPCEDNQRATERRMSASVRKRD